MKLRLIIILLGILNLQDMNVRAQIPDFFREEITIELFDSLVSVTGIYYYQNNKSHDLNIDMFYPFPQHDTYGKVDHVFAFEMQDTLVNVLKKTTPEAALIELTIPAFQQKTLCIGYTQEVLSKKAEYIVTTTKAWGKPVNLASFELVVPSYYRVDSLEYIPYDTLISRDKTYYYFREVNFWPDKEFEIFFSKPN